MLKLNYLLVLVSVSFLINLSFGLRLNKKFLSDINDGLDGQGFNNTQMISFSDRNRYNNAVLKSKFDELSGIFKASINKVKYKNKKIDMIFLIDSSSSVGKNNFHSEVKFVKKILSDFTVSFNHTRVAIVTFSSQGKIIRHIDQISVPKKENDKCMLINYEIPKIKFVGGGTFTFGALKEAKEIFAKARRHSKKLIFLITDGFSNGRDPVPMAIKLKNDNVTIFSIGIQNGNYVELFDIASSPGEQFSFLLNSFAQFESLARKALHIDFRVGNYLSTENETLCNVLCERNSTSMTCCDENAECTCATASGHYTCMCKPGYYGSGLKGSCSICPNATYWHSANLCKPCPDINHITIKSVATGIGDCVCKSGFKSYDDHRCEVITCPKLTVPENGYFVEHPTGGCGNVLNTACGARCKSGYQLSGSSIRLCQQNGTWSGTETNCILKTCPALSVPYYGLAICRNADLNLAYDYSPRNTTFMAAFDNSELRITEPMPIDTDCNFRCAPGYYLVGSGTRNCLPISKWDGLQTTCKHILCSALPRVAFGQYDPTDCDEGKLSHGTNCSIECLPGFELKGPAMKTCLGKRNGVWTNKNKNVKCVDIEPPIIICPNDYTIFMEENDNYALVKNLSQPKLVTDNSGVDVSFWSKPAIKENGIKLYGGDYTFSYVAVDAFKNKARCNFTVKIIDTTPPVLDNCIDPPDFYIKIKNNEKTFIEWEDPIIYDNSNENITITQSLEPGYLNVGNYQVKYVATDLSHNTNECVLNITVKELKCYKLEAPTNGNIICASNSSHMWCDIRCNFGYAMYDEFEEVTVENITLKCEHDYPKWKYDILPDCTQLQLPDSVEEVFTISLDTESAFCNDSSMKNEMAEEFKNYAKKYLCAGQEDCEIISDIPFCNDNENQSNDNSEDDDGTVEKEADDKTVYHVVKRDVQNNTSKLKKKNKVNLRINVYAKLSKKLGIWNPNITRQENAEFFKNELSHLDENKDLRKKLESMRIDLTKLRFEEKIKCQNGSVMKKQICVQCPRGSFHNASSNNCQACPLATYNDRPGAIECKRCQINYSTRKTSSKFEKHCVEQCPPGTMARLKMVKKLQKPFSNNTTQGYQKSLMPYCKKCPPGEYQAMYNQLKCETCPDGFLSPRASKSITDCAPKRLEPCKTLPNVCGENGDCIPDLKNPFLYSCSCREGFIGSHCEQRIDFCLSAPCLNGGICHNVNNTEIRCQCSHPFDGIFCEEIINPCKNDTCKNNGTCLEINGNGICECLPGFDGDHCEIQKDYCAHNPCKAGECINKQDGYYCNCPPGVIGRRCHLHPCDYIPCQGNNICVDLLHNPANKSSFSCKCPKGFKGYDCLQIDNPCDRNPCKNNGICSPVMLRNDSVISVVMDETKFDEFTCTCPPYFYGNLCQILVTPDYVLEFEKPQVTDYVKLPGPKKDLKEISICKWMQTSDNQNYGTIISYATEECDNMFTLTDYSGLALYVNGSHIISDIVANDGEWHFICVAWMSENGFYEMYLDGTLYHTGYNLSSGDVIKGGGILILGQDQDDLGSSFSESETFIGKLAYLDIWDKFLRAHEVQEFYTTCEPYQGNLYQWSDFKSNIIGNVLISKSPFCKSCSTDIEVSNGFISFFSNKAQYSCSEGYKLEGLPLRNCLRTSQWQLPAPVCRLIICGYLSQISNGRTLVSKQSYGGFATYFCNEGFNLIGTAFRKCQLNGIWSGSVPECVSLVSCAEIIASNSNKVMYGTDKGPVATKSIKYPAGTIAEIQCINGTVANGDNILTCLDTGYWDMPIPFCIELMKSTTVEGNTSTEFGTNTIDMERIALTTSFSTTKKIPTTPLELEVIQNTTTDYFPIYTTSYQLTSTDTDSSNDIVTRNPSIAAIENKFQPTEIEIEDQEMFWTNLRNYLYHGCGSTVSDNMFCNTKHHPNVTDLANPNLPQSQNSPLMEVILLNVLNQTVLSKDLTTMTFYNFFDIIKNASNIPAADENYYRLMICFSMDLIIWNTEKYFISDAVVQRLDENDENIDTNEKIRILLVKILKPVYENYVLKKSQMNFTRSFPDDKSIEEFYTTPTQKNQRIRPILCDKNLLPQVENSEIYKMINSAYMEIDSTDIFDVGLKILYKCVDNFQMQGNFTTTCTSNGWTFTEGICVAMCPAPQIPVNLQPIAKNLIDEIFLAGEKIQLSCRDGYMIYGNPIIQCLPTGKWTKILSRCSKITCNKPKLPLNAVIFSGRSYLYQDKIKIKCSNEIITEIECQSSGFWYPKDIC